MLAVNEHIFKCATLLVQLNQVVHAVRLRFSILTDLNRLDSNGSIATCRLPPLSHSTWQTAKLDRPNAVPTSIVRRKLFAHMMRYSTSASARLTPEVRACNSCPSAD